MNFKSITATVSTGVLDKVEKRLRQIGVPGVSVTETEGYGVYKNFFQRDWLGTYARIQIYAPESQTDEIVCAIVESAHTGVGDDGIVAVSPVERLIRVSDKTEMAPGQFEDLRPV